MRMSRSVAPTAILMPISRVRSVTETSMMFMMPMPPTTSDINAIEPSSIDIIVVVLRRASSICETLRTAKSSARRHYPVAFAQKRLRLVWM